MQHYQKRKSSHLWIAIILVLLDLGIVFFLKPANFFIITAFITFITGALFYSVYYFKLNLADSLFISLCGGLVLAARAAGLKHWIYIIFILLCFTGLWLFTRKKHP